MEVPVNYWAVLLAAVSSMAIGSLWYSKAMFLDSWVKLGRVKTDPNWDNSKMKWMLLMVFGGSLVTAYVLAHVAYISSTYFQNAFLQDTLVAAFLVWLGFSAARIATHDLFENRRKKFTLINVGNEFATLMVMGLIIGLMGV